MKSEHGDSCSENLLRTSLICSGFVFSASNFAGLPTSRVMGDARPADVKLRPMTLTYEQKLLQYQNGLPGIEE